ncbi:MAG: DMT family transporter [Gammaproteobacteria bacterium]|nr:DMT family transporter [Gammaproteobacteria bacterium]
MIFPSSPSSSNATPPRPPGAGTALLAALLFGASTPVAKLLLTDASPWMIAGLLYLGSGIGLSLVRRLRRAPRVRLAPHEWPWLAGAIVTGGVAAPVLLMQGLMHMPASGAALLLNFEGVLTALLAWFAFKENFDGRIALGMLAIVAGAVVLSWPEKPQFGEIVPSLLILAACLAWALDNNLTRQISLADASWIASKKGLCAGGVNLLLAAGLGDKLPPWITSAAALSVGFVAYGLSLSLFVVALRQLGTARTGAYFSVAPFFGTVIAIAVLNDPLTDRLVVAGCLMAIGIWIHVRERHDHVHSHEAMEHEHEHEHGLHHQHAHDDGAELPAPHTHVHRHAPVTHAHPHYPDAHHRHRH